MIWFLVPAILAGRPALLVALVASLTVMFITVVLTNGLGAQTFAAALGIAATLVLACLMAALAVRFTNLYGDADFGLAGLETADRLSVRGIIMGAVLVGALGSARGHRGHAGVRSRWRCAARTRVTTRGDCFAKRS